MKKFLVFFLYLLIFNVLHAQIKTGAEQLDLYYPILKDKKIALCANQTSLVDKSHLVDTLVALKLNIVKIFSPEHGFRGDAEAGAHIASSIDPKTGIPIISLYGGNRKPSADQMKNIDIIVFDIQDVGCRFFTFISTLSYLMEAAAENNIELMVLDRPNPNGYFVDGPVMEDKYKSFVGMHNIPIVYGMTIAEFATMINEEGWLLNGVKCKLYTIPVANYNHKMRYSLPIHPSPNLQTDESVALYASLCLFEGTDISLGRGTDKPFQCYGHPGLLNGDFYFTPIPIKGISEKPPHNGENCRGFDLTHYADSVLKDTNLVNISFLINAFNNHPHKDAFFTRAAFFDKLAGNSTLRWQIIYGKSEEEIRNSWEPKLTDFKKIRKKYLLYPDFE